MADKEESPEGKKEAPQRKQKKKKIKSKARPLGSPQEEPETPEGDEVPEETPGGNKGLPQGEKRKTNNSSKMLEETTKTPPGEKEAKMPLDEEVKEFVRETVKVGVGPLKEDAKATKGALAKANEALTSIREKLATPPGPVAETKGPPFTKGEVALEAAEIIREEQEKARKILQDGEARKKEREDLERLRKLCLDNPELAKCKDMGEYIDQRTLAKVEEVLEKANKEPKVEPSAGLSLPKKFEELTTKDQEALRKQVGEKIPHPILLGILEECSKGDDPEKCDLAGHIARVFPKETAHKLLEEGKKEVVTTVCKDGECKPIRVSLEEEGIAMYQKTESGTWEPVDEELKKKVEEAYEKRLEEELKKRKPSF